MTQQTPKRIRTDRELVEAMRSLPPEVELNEYECGCKIVRESAGAVFIRWCQTHQAAPELQYAALLLAKLDGRKDLPPDLQPKIETAKAAIAKATGQEVT